MPDREPTPRYRLLGVVERDVQPKEKEPDDDVFTWPHFLIRHVVDFEAEVVDAGVLEGALCLGRLVVFELQDREIYVAVAQIVALGGWGVDLTHLLQAEALNVELRRRL